MNRTHFAKLFFLSSILILALASCSLPYVTPPAEYATQAATVSTPVVATQPTAIPTPTPKPELITAANSASLKSVNIVPATNVKTLTWASDSSSLGLVSQNEDANGNAVFSATVLDPALNIKYLLAASNGDVFVRVSPDGHEVAAISSDGNTATMYDLAQNNAAVVQISQGYRVYDITFSPDGNTFGLIDGDAMTVNLYTLSQSSDPYPLTGFTTAAPVFDASYAGNANTLVWHARGTLQLQDISTKTMGATFSHEDFVTAFTLSVDGKVLASASAKTVNGDEKPVVELWDAASGAETNDLILPQAATSLSFSPDGSLLAVATGNDVQVWNVASASLLTTLSGHSGLVDLVAFSPDGKSLVSYGQDNQLILWQVIPAK
jgi:dipeptidyl aminopeptidase/acylaminoacyl peptidase